MSYPTHHVSWDFTFGLAAVTVRVDVPEGIAVEFDGGSPSGRACEYAFGERMAFRCRHGNEASSWVDLGTAQPKAVIAASGFALAGNVMKGA
jgi:hypothetical protein